MAAAALFPSSDESSSSLNDSNGDSDYKPLNWCSLTDTSDLESSQDEVIPPSPDSRSTAVTLTAGNQMPCRRPTSNSVLLNGLPCATDAALSSAEPDHASHGRTPPSPDSRSTAGNQMPCRRPTTSANSVLLNGLLCATDAALSSAEPDHASHGRISPSLEAMAPNGRPETPTPTDTAPLASAPGPASHRTRKRQRNPSNWKHNQRQKLTQAGKEYVSMRNKPVPAKSIKDVKACETKCKFKCKSKISEMEREGLHENFKALDFVQKHSFILSTTECHEKASQKETRRAKSYTYTFVVQGHKLRVCKSYYLGTLSISQKMVYGAHRNKNTVTGTPKSDGRGKHAKKKIPDEDKDGVISHINSFPRVESHYCRATTNKEYLETGLNLQKMYDLYKEKCEEEGVPPVKLSYYRHIFNYSFNLEFHHRKTDRCDLCEKNKVAKAQGLLTEADEKEHSLHILNKEAMRKASEEDKQDQSIDVLVSFDLQNVISLPRADISSFFYKRKLNVYNLTGHLMDHRTSSKKGYCVIWPENLSGRAGNDIASAFIRMLEKITEERSDIKRITTWSDSCVPQNRNRIISHAIHRFLHLHQNIDSITMKFSVPGHSCVQSVDNMHSQIEKTLMANEVFSPVTLMRVLKKVNQKSPFTIIQMKAQDFKDFKSSSDSFQFENIPFSRVSVLKFKKEPTVFFKLNHYTDFQSVSVRKEIKTRKASKKQSISCTNLHFPLLKVASGSHALSREKISDLKSMLPFMSAVDKAYYTPILDMN